MALERPDYWKNFYQTSGAKNLGPDPDKCKCGDCPCLWRSFTMNLAAYIVRSLDSLFYDTPDPDHPKPADILDRLERAAKRIASECHEPPPAIPAPQPNPSPAPVPAPNNQTKVQPSHVPTTPAPGSVQPPWWARPPIWIHNDIVVPISVGAKAVADGIQNAIPVIEEDAQQAEQQLEGMPLPIP
jgi:hypothetical protein